MLNTRHFGHFGYLQRAVANKKCKKVYTTRVIARLKEQ